MQGTLFRYGSKQWQIAFMSGSPDIKRHVIAIGGMGDGMLYAPYIPMLANRLKTMNWSLVSLHLKSSYDGYGCCILEDDAKEVLGLVHALQSTYSTRAICLLGHSTGCQTICRFIELYSPCVASYLKGFVFQAPVSDPESKIVDGPNEIHEANLLQASQLVNDGRPHVLLDQNFTGHVPITAERYVSAYTRYGDEDYFSSYLTPEQLEDKFEPIWRSRIPGLIILSGEDEWVPRSVDIDALATKLQRAMGPLARAHVVTLGKHDLRDTEDVALREIVNFINKLHVDNV